LDLLEHEDRILLDLFGTIGRCSGSSVEARYDYGNAAKQVVRHGALREACIVDLRRALVGEEPFGPFRNRWLSGTTHRRRLLNAVGDASRSIQGISLLTGQDFDGLLDELVGALTAEITGDLEEAIPNLRNHLSPAGAARLHAATYVRRHAPTRLHPTGPNWVERSALASRLATIWDHLCDHPRASPEARVT